MGQSTDQNKGLMYKPIGLNTSKTHFIFLHSIMCSTLANIEISNVLYKYSWLEWIGILQETGLQLQFSDHDDEDNDAFMSAFIQLIQPQLQVAGGGRNGGVFSLRLLPSEHELTFLIRGVDVISVAHHGPDGLSQTVPVGLFGALIQQSVRHQARITSVLQILGRKKRGTFLKKSTQRQNAAWSAWSRWLQGDLTTDARSSYLLDAVGPSLFDSIFGPHVVCVLGQFVNQNLLTCRQLHVREIQRRRLVSIRHHIAAKQKHSSQRSITSAEDFIPTNFWPHFFFISIL